ncbi:MAG: hypothetical protein RIQ89_874 [Bacteroidota bacterium]|jgi:phosphatidylserine decarboxylase
MIHREGYPTIIVTLVFILLLNLVVNYFTDTINWIHYLSYAVSVFLMITVLQFFRNPKRNLSRSDYHLIAPADGKVVVIEETYEPEFFKDKRLQVSIFMSPINVHVNRYALSGKIIFARYHPGKFLVAWHPKSSTENERTTMVMETGNGKQFMFRQIAGALARRIVLYAKAGLMVKQGEEMGFIKFGSRVDIFLPLGTPVDVVLNQKVIGGKTVIAQVG